MHPAPIPLQIERVRQGVGAAVRCHSANNDQVLAVWSERYRGESMRREVDARSDRPRGVGTVQLSRQHRFI